MKYDEEQMYKLIHLMLDDITVFHDISISDTPMNDIFYCDKLMKAHSVISKESFNTQVTNTSNNDNVIKNISNKSITVIKGENTNVSQKIEEIVNNITNKNKNIKIYNSIESNSDLLIIDASKYLDEYSSKFTVVKIYDDFFYLKNPELKNKTWNLICQILNL